MTTLARHVCAAAHPLAWRLRHFSADGQGHGKNRRNDDQDKGARQRRDHDAEVNTVIMRINADRGLRFREDEFVRKSGE